MRVDVKCATTELFECHGIREIISDSDSGQMPKWWKRMLSSAAPLQRKNTIKLSTADPINYGDMFELRPI